MVGDQRAWYMFETIGFSDPNPRTVKVQEKLVRDKIVNLVGPGTFSFRTAEDSEMPRLLAYKLLEETEELFAEIVNIECRDSTDTTKVLSEGADLLEALYSTIQRYGFSQEELHLEMLRKRSEKGGFKGNQVLIY